MRINAKFTSTKGTDYSYYIKLWNLFNQPRKIYIMPLVINSLGSGHTLTCPQTYTHIHTYRCLHKGKFKKPDADLWLTHACFKNVCIYTYIGINYITLAWVLRTRDLPRYTY